jgi:hypothetical protein
VSDEPKQSHAGEMCRCGRPRNTPADLDRWRAEFPDGQAHTDPDWAQAICWYTGDLRSCNRIHIDKRNTLP